MGYGMTCASAAKTTGAALAQLAQNRGSAPVRQSGYKLKLIYPRQALTGATQPTGARLAQGGVR